MKKLSLLLFLAVALQANANHDLGQGLRVSDTKLRELERALNRTTSERTFYHWTNFKTALRWSLQGHIDRGEVDFYNRPTGDRQVYGPGIYLAESPTSSNGFGSTAVTFKMSSGTPIYDSSVVARILGQNLSSNQASALGGHIPLIRNATGDWWVTNHANNTSKVEFAHAEGSLAPQWKDVKTWEMIDGLTEVARQHQSASYLESLIHLSSYMDGISFFRALKVNPSNPWAEFEPQHFEKYRSARQLYFDKASKGEAIGVAQSGTQAFGAQSYSKELWVGHQINQILPEIYERLSGERNPNRNYFRGEGVRAGGDQVDRTFLVNDQELEVLKKNPYIEVEAKPHPSGQGHLVAYHYPDVFHFKKLQGKISNELFNQLSNTSEQELWRNHRLRQHLNNRLIRELLENLFSTYHGKRANFKAEGTQFLKDLISIHPFKDYNGRSSRLYTELAHLDSKIEMPYSFLGDLDLLTETQTYKDILEKGAKAHKELVEAMVLELMKAKHERRMPAYRDLPELIGLWKALEPIGGNGQINLSQRELEMIRKRQFRELFETLFAGTKDAHFGGSCRTIFN